MTRILTVLSALMIVLAACTPAPPKLGADGKPLPSIYKLNRMNPGDVQFRMLDAVNTLRASSGAPQLELDSKLNAAAATHARDMSAQNRPWHFGSDGSSPIDRVARVGYTGQLIGEVISETYETELQTLSAWMADPSTRRILMSQNANRMGFS